MNSDGGRRIAAELPPELVNMWRGFRTFLHRIGGGLRKKVGKEVIHSAVRSFATEGLTLDLGCGESPTDDALPNRVGTDIASGRGVDVVSDAHNIPFRSEVFDHLVCSEVLEHLHDPDAAVKEMHRVLTSCGRLILTVPFCFPVHEAPHDYHRFTQYGLERLFSAGFDIEEIRPLFTEEQTLAVLLQRIAFQRADHPLRHWFYLVLARFLYGRNRNCTSQRYQTIRRDRPGHFLTANYLLVARKKETDGGS